MGKKQAIRNPFCRLGLHAKTKNVVQALAQLGVQVNEELVPLVRIEMLKQTTGRKPAKNSRAGQQPCGVAHKDFLGSVETGEGWRLGPSIPPRDTTRITHSVGSTGERTFPM